MAYKKGESVEHGIWRLAEDKGYLVEVSVTCADTGKRIRKRKTIGRLDLARAWRDTVRADGIRGEITKEEKRKEITFKDFAERYLQAWAPSRKPNTVRTETQRIRNILNPQFGTRYLHTLTRQEVEVYLAKRRDGEIGPRLGKIMTPASCNRELCRIKNMLKKAVDWGYLKANPVESLKQEREYVREADFLSGDEVGRLIAACDAQLRPIIVVAAYTGLRLGELMRLEWRDVDVARGQLTVRDTKNGDTRYVPVAETVLRILDEHRASQTRDLGAIARGVFVNVKTGKPFRDFRKRYRSALRRAGIDRHFTFHGLRHTAASHLVMSGSDLRTVGAVLGHRTPQMTLRYAHLSPGYLRDAAKRLDAYFGGNEDQRASDGHFMDTLEQNKESRPMDDSLSLSKTAS
jgi:integrase